MNAKVMLALLVLLLVMGCAGAGTRVEAPITYPRGEKLTVVAHNQIAPDWFLSKDKLAINYIVSGSVTPEQLDAVAKTEDACRIYTKTVRPHDLVIVLSSGVLYGLAGYVGVGFGSQAFPGADFGEYAKYGGAASGASGLANGVISLGGKTYTFENCSHTALSKVSQYGISVIQKSPY